MAGEDTTTYPNLGFNPVPGVPENVEALAGKVSAAVDSMAEADGLLNRMRDASDNVWQGDAGDAFREHFNEKLMPGLTRAHESLNRAVGLLRTWHSDLVSFKQSAAQLDEEARQAKQRYQQAQTRLEQARSNPDLRLAGQFFSDEQSLQNARARLAAAEASVRDASARVDESGQDVEAIMRRARELQDSHEEDARRIAERLWQAAFFFAPHKPGRFSGMFHAFTSALSAVGHWVGDHLDAIHSVLATISAVSGLVALLTPPPIDAIALGVSVVAGAGALATDLANPEFRHGIGELMHGHFNRESLGAAFTGVTDALSVVPGVGVAARSLRGTEAAAEGAAALPRITEIASTVAHNPGLPARLISRVPGVGTALEATRLIDQGAGQSIMVTQNMVNILWHGKSAASDLYHDVSEAVS